MNSSFAVVIRAMNAESSEMRMIEILMINKQSMGMKNRHEKVSYI